MCARPARSSPASTSTTGAVAIATVRLMASTTAPVVTASTRFTGTNASSVTTPAPTAVAIALPDGYAAFVHPRSGLAARHGLTILNAPGTVDAGYRGEISVTLLNTDPEHTLTLISPRYPA